MPEEGEIRRCSREARRAGWGGRYIICPPFTAPCSPQEALANHIAAPPRPCVDPCRLTRRRHRCTQRAHCAARPTASAVPSREPARGFCRGVEFRPAFGFHVVLACRARPLPGGSFLTLAPPRSFLFFAIIITPTAFRRFGADSGLACLVALRRTAVQRIAVWHRRHRRHRTAPDSAGQAGVPRASDMPEGSTTQNLRLH